MIDVEVWTGLEALRLRRALRMSQREYAAHLGVSERTIAKWDSRGVEIRPRGEYQRVLDTALAQAPVEAQERFRALGDSQARVTPRQYRIDAAAGQLTSSTEGTVSGLSETTAGADAVETYEQLMVDYAAFDNSSGPKLVVNVVTRRATALIDQLAQSRGGAWVGTARMAARYAEFAGWLHQDAGDPICAGRWTETALSIAHASGDEGMIAYTLMRRSNQAAEQDHVGMAAGLADAALSTIGAGTPRIRALGYRQKAAGLALARDPGGCIDALARARDEIASDPSWNPLTGYCTIHYLDAEAAVCFMRLGKPERAINLLAPAISTWPSGYIRDKGFYQAHFAEALALSGEAEAAIGQARQAASLVATCGSRRTAARLHRVPALLDAMDQHQIAADLRHELTTVMV